MPASISEAFDSPYNEMKEEEPTLSVQEKKTDLDYNSVLSPFFPKSTVKNAPYSSPTPQPYQPQQHQQQQPQQQQPQPQQQQQPQQYNEPPQLSGRDLLPLYSGPSAAPMRSGQHDCHDQIASILSCRVCREKLKLLLNDDYFRGVQSGGGQNIVSSLFTLTQNADLVNLFLIIGMALIIHKLFRK